MMHLISLLNVSGLLLLVSCNKDDSKPTAPTAKPTIAVALNKQYVDGAKVDSAIVVWEVNNQKKTSKMRLRNDSLITDITQFQQC
jgi:hypothetical protein